ncbi:hypothetical protein ACQPZ8_20575 [Actinomadura nitritigenes]|uniref:hypothetical protein n=1 Tax=Actinomadura nitritigenes TaxID=134602 RepID=UPI003D918DE3
MARLQRVARRRADTAEQRPWRDLFGRAMWRRTLVGGLFWTALAVPNFSLFVFCPTS